MFLNFDLRRSFIFGYQRRNQNRIPILEKHKKNDLIHNMTFYLVSYLNIKRQYWRRGLTGVNMRTKIK